MRGWVHVAGTLAVLAHSNVLGCSCPACPRPPPATMPFESRVTGEVTRPSGPPHEPVVPTQGAERTACDELTRHATAHVEDTVTGAVVILTPNPDSEIEDVLRCAHRFADAVESGARPDARCPLLEFGPPWSFPVIRVEDRRTVRLLLESRDRATILALRDRVRAYASSLPPYARDERLPNE